MNSPMPEHASTPNPRVLVVSICFAPCREVGGKRFSFLSKYLVDCCDEYHVLSRVEKECLVDSTAFSGNVHRVRARPNYPPIRRRGLLSKLSRAWEKWFCVIDPFIGWAIPAALKGIRLARRHRLNVVIVTVPYFSAMIAGTLISFASNARLILDYRDPMTSFPRQWPRPFGRRASLTLERAAVGRASAIVFCSDIMKEEFLASFSGIAPKLLAVIHNGFLEFEDHTDISLGGDRVNMVYAGHFYGSRRLSMIAPALAEMQRAGEISPQTFRLHLYSKLRDEDFELMAHLGIGGLIAVHEQVPYHEMQRILRAADILFLPSGKEFAYAVPFKFFDYISARRPILGIAPTGSSVCRMMQIVDCGEFAAFGDMDSIRHALLKLISRAHPYTFRGAEHFRWQHAASAYQRVIAEVLDDNDVAA